MGGDDRGEVASVVLEAEIDPDDRRAGTMVYRGAKMRSLRN